MAELSREALEFVTQALGCSLGPDEIVQALKTHFMTEVSEENLRLYDPTQDPSPAWVSPFLIRLFAATRAVYKAGLESWAGECSAGHGTKAHRLALLRHTFNETGAGGDLERLGPRESWLALNLMEEAAKVSNDRYEQGGDVSTGDARMIQLVTLSRDVDELLNDYEGEDQGNDLEGGDS